MQTLLLLVVTVLAYCIDPLVIIAAAIAASQSRWAISLGIALVEGLALVGLTAGLASILQSRAQSLLGIVIAVLLLTSIFKLVGRGFRAWRRSSRNRPPDLPAPNLPQ
jgi:uncharacterized oligopeptide transporter (OPT) family protein